MLKVPGSTDSSTSLQPLLLVVQLPPHAALLLLQALQLTLQLRSPIPAGRRQCQTA